MPGTYTLRFLSSPVKEHSALLPGKLSAGSLLAWLLPFFDAWIGSQQSSLSHPLNLFLRDETAQGSCHCQANGSSLRRPPASRDSTGRVMFSKPVEEVEGEHLTLIKSFYEKPTGNILFDDERLDVHFCHFYSILPGQSI
ncbi:hypothetical protein VULLAG_LOCUS19179 [Vulpes lagopus]